MRTIVICALAALVAACGGSASVASLSTMDLADASGLHEGGDEASGGGTPDAGGDAGLLEEGGSPDIHLDANGETRSEAEAPDAIGEPPDADEPPPDTGPDARPACRPVPGLDEQCADARTPHAYACVGLERPPPACVIRSIGNLTNTYCCP
jgi:hypothetical protein